MSSSGSESSSDSGSVSEGSEDERKDDAKQERKRRRPDDSRDESRKKKREKKKHKDKKVCRIRILRTRVGWPNGACRPRRRRRRRTRGRNPKRAKRVNTTATLARTTTKPKRQGPSNYPNGPSTIRLHSCLCVACSHALWHRADGDADAPRSMVTGEIIKVPSPPRARANPESRTHSHIRYVSAVLPARHGVGCSSIETACRSRLARFALTTSDSSTHCCEPDPPKKHSNTQAVGAAVMPQNSDRSSVSTHSSISHAYTERRKSPRI